MSGAAIAFLPRSSGAWAAASALPRTAKPLPLSAVRLKPSHYATAVEVNRKYLLSLDPDRFLHNFRKFAALEPKAPIYGGWESDTIAGHTLGHYLTALVLTNAQTGCEDCRRRADYIVRELAEVQAKRRDGYVGGLQRKRKDGSVVDGEEIFPEIMRGEIRSGGFDLNGSWAPLYTVHKLCAGLLDVHAGWGNQQALAVLTRLGDYFERVFAALNDAQMQEMLACEYGGLTESFAELHARTGDKRWLAVAERLYDRKVLDPLAAEQDKLANFHANTQVPKLIGLARLHELTGKPAYGTAARFFWTRVTGHHSYVIGGNADREYFFEPDTVANHITEQTCEHCNTYNMLKLTRQLYSWQPNGALFDYYERAHLNHVMSAQDPATGGFTYMTPLMTGIPRGYSSPDEDSFWCCVGSGMESHAKHGEAIFWEGEGALLVNLYIPATAEWKARGAALSLDTRYPYGTESRLTLDRLARPGRFRIALRVPGWAKGRATIAVNGKPAAPIFADGYAIVERRWQPGDVVTIDVPLDLRIESTPGDPDTIAFLRGPMVLAADLGAVPAGKSGRDVEGYDGVAPAMVGEDLLTAFVPVDPGRSIYQAKGIARPADLTFVPFYSQYRRRSAVYFKRFSDAGWAAEQAAFLAEQARARDIAARSVDVMHLGEMQPERDHDLASEISYPVTYRALQGRDARSGGFFSFKMKVKPGPLILQASYWGDERRVSFDILVDGVKIGSQVLDHDKPGSFFDVEYPIPEAVTKGKAEVLVKFVPHDRSRVGPVFGVRIFTAKPAPIA
ncbi:glycoside hydrolase family 127 protein [Allosphingosinicella deserti]|uniref:Glycoside hydrolase family 127 protein n=1 Tax=Allosphingosinicella deserti TaxID=2116704 RepID=A0A2P7QPT6_9SPHN|nr:glycoside hydrolase family 127 protein [Sphingomonas deserti]PSJ39960.1 hypothetical protein C7I55_12530 [Sphingomonas deserti]